jgi:hypothetical protein
MKKVTLLRLLTAVGSALTTLAALDLAGFAKFFEPGVAVYLLAAGPAALALKEIVVVLGDWFDDGKPNKSFKVGLLATALVLLSLPLLLVSCSTPPVHGTASAKAGQFTVDRNGRVQIILEPRTSK